MATAQLAAKRAIMDLSIAAAHSLGHAYVEQFMIKDGRQMAVIVLKWSW